MIFKSKDLNIWYWQRYLLVWHKDECCYLGFSTQSISQYIYSPLSHPPDLSSSRFLRSPSAHTNSYLPQIQHNQCFMWPWLNPFFLHVVERVEWLFSAELTPSAFPVRAETFPQARVHSSTRRVLPRRNGASKLHKSYHFICTTVNGPVSALIACHLTQH